MALGHRRKGFVLTAFLGALSALPPISIDTGLPGLPAIEAEFANGAGRGALTLSLFLLGFAIAPLFGGPVADRFGRRGTLLAGLALYAAAALACALSTSFEMLLGFRALQGIAAGICVILPLAIVRDLYDHATARGKLSTIFAVFSIAPMVVPMLGAAIMAFSGWRMIYVAEASIGVLLAIGTLGFRESLPAKQRRSLHPSQLLAGYRSVLTDRSFVGYTLVFAFAFSCMFSFISGASAVLMGALQLSRSEFAVIYGVTSGSVMVGSLLSGALSKRQVPSRRLVGLGLGLMGASALAILALEPLGLARAAMLMPLVALVMVSFGLIGPNANHEAMRNMAEVAGAASGAIRCLQMLISACASAMVALLQPLGHPVLTTASLMVAMALLAGATFIWLQSGATAGLQRDGD
ncbi:MAG: multidrug effflux MFS transporter [Rhodopseudomonas sp.]|uniref:multidrug effflux MFS transporter n=1 Tax=Rhodopseudomonas sp. TaxID=1078 RepID=UPI001858E594|nr:multidrug effflux MFS transporter [Rhodopseudomonas sp.]NVN88264.1 multidrug effflux MFS transporter [Rhodopseudomonas sp.]